MNAYTQSAFDAMEAAAKAYRDAAIKEIVDNAEFEKDAKVKECDHYKLIAEEEGSKLEVYTYQYDDPGTVIRPLIYDPDDTDFLDDLGDKMTGFTTWNTALKTATSSATTTNNTHGSTSAVNARKTATTAAITATKSDNETIREETEKQTEKEYKDSENTGWNEYYAASIGAENAYLSNYKRSEKAFDAAKKNADDVYMTTVVPAYLSYAQQLHDLETLFTSAVAHAGDANFNAGDYFANGTSGNQGDYVHVALQQQGGGEEDMSLYDTPLLKLAYEEFYSKIKPGVSFNIIRAEAKTFMVRNRELFNSDEEGKFVELYEWHYYIVNLPPVEHIKEEVEKAELPHVFPEEYRPLQVAATEAFKTYAEEVIAQTPKAVTPDVVDVPVVQTVPQKEVCASCVPKYPNAVSGMKALASIPLGREMIEALIRDRRISGLYCVEGIDFRYLDNGGWGYYDGLKQNVVTRGRPGINIYMTEVNSGVAWAGLFAHEYNHVFNPGNNDYNNELLAFRFQIIVLNQLYKNSDYRTEAKAILDTFPFAVPNWGRDEFTFDEKEFKDWFLVQDAYQRPRTGPFFRSPLRFTININQNNDLMFGKECIAGQCACQCHKK